MFRIFFMTKTSLRIQWGTRTAVTHRDGIVINLHILCIIGHELKIFQRLTMI